MKIFEITPKIKVVCDYAKTRNGFKHIAKLCINGEEVEETKCCYLNRTWERYEYQSVLQKVIDKSKFLSDEEKAVCMEFAKGDHTNWDAFKMTGMIAKMGEVLCTDQKEKNDWKARMIKAGLGNSGLIMPDDWESLGEDEKEKRLDLVINQISALPKTA